MSEDRFDALERGHEERRRAAQDLAGMLGISGAREPEASTEAQPEEPEEPEGESSARRDEQGRFIAGSADVAEHGAPVLPTPNMGAMILALLDERS
jgi:hypothetical protein